MRNLKRALSLALASIMVFGMMVVGAGAASYEDFTDKAEIKNTEAVNTMVSLGVINGKGDGSTFDPAGSLTRAEACTLIARALGGGKDPVMGSNIKSTFKDTQGHWAESYIAYCANLGIIAGVGNNTFAPDATLTGSAAAKMMICALGYKPEFEGIKGAAWEIATNTLANKIKLYDGLEKLNPSETISRDNVAQLIYNGVQANEVQYRNLQGDYSGTVYATANGTMLANRFGVVKVTGILLANDMMSVDTGANAAKEGYSILNVTAVSGYNTVPATLGSTFKVVSDSSMVGQEIVLYVKLNNALSPNAANSTVMGTPILTDSNTVVETSAKMVDASKVKDALKDSGLSVGNAGEKEFLYTIAGRNDGTNTNGVVAKPGLVQTFIDNNNDGKVDYILKELASLAKVSAYSTSSKTLTLSGGIGSKDFSDVVGADKVAKDDYVLAVDYTGSKTYVVKAETVSGKVTAYNSSNSKVTIDGTAYAAGDIDAANKSGLSTATALSEMVGDEYKLYLDMNGNILAYEMVSGSVGNLALVLASGVSESTLGGVYSGEVKLLLADGTKVTYSVNMKDSAKDLGAATTVNTDTKKETYTANALSTGLSSTSDTTTPTLSAKGGLNGEIVTYTVNDDKTVTLGLPGKVNSKYASAYEASAKAFSNKTTSYGGAVADNNTVFFIGDDANGYSVITGLSKLSNTSKDSVKFVSTNSDNVNNKYGTVVTYDNNGTSVAKAVFLPYGASYTSTSKYAYVFDDYSKISSTEYEYPVVLEDGTVTTLKAKDSGATESGALYAYTLNSDGYATFTTPSEITNGDVVTYASGTSLSLASGQNKSTTDSGVLKDAKIWNVADAELGKADSVFAETALSENMSICYAKDTDGYITKVFVNDTNAVFADVKNNSGVSLTINEQTVANGASAKQVASGYAVEVKTLAANSDVSYTYTVGSTSFTKTVKANATGVATISMPENSTSGIVITGATLKATAAPTSVKLASGASKTLTITSTPVTLTANGTTVAAATGFTDTSADNVKFTIEDAASTASTATLKIGGEAATAYVSGTDVDVASAAGPVTLILTVTSTASGMADTVTVYTVTLTVA